MSDPTWSEARDADTNISSQVKVSSPPAVLRFITKVPGRMSLASDVPIVCQLSNKVNGRNVRLDKEQTVRRDSGKGKRRRRYPILYSRSRQQPFL